MWRTTRPCTRRSRWSVARLDDTERRVLQQLAVFTSPFTEAAAAAVLDGGAASTDLAALHRLVDKGLVQLDDATDRYRLLQTTQHFCRQSERVPTDEPSAQRARVQHEVRQAVQVGHHLRAVGDDGHRARARPGGPRCGPRRGGPPARSRRGPRTRWAARTGR